MRAKTLEEERERIGATGVYWTSRGWKGHAVQAVERPSYGSASFLGRHAARAWKQLRYGKGNRQPD